MEYLEKNDTTGIVEALKVMTSTQLTQIEAILKCVAGPEREEFSTEEEYQEENKKFMMEMINSIEAVKLRLFDDVLDSYNEYLAMKFDLEKEFKRQNEESAAYVIQANSDIKNTAIVSLVATFLFPYALPVIAALGLSRVGFDTIQAKSNNNRIIRNNDIQIEIEEIQDPLYDLTCNLRSDYHASKKVFKELKEKANNGENIMPELIELVNPERVELERIDGAAFFLEIEEEPKQFIKRD